MDNRATIEFWVAKKGFLISITTDAPPPPVGSTINIGSKDYSVTVVDYSVDQQGTTKSFRRNVHLTPTKEG